MLFDLQEFLVKRQDFGRTLRAMMVSWSSAWARTCSRCRDIAILDFRLRIALPKSCALQEILKIEEHRLRLKHQAGGGGHEICARRADLVDVLFATRFRRSRGRGR